jgi:hypothetical protein
MAYATASTHHSPEAAAKEIEAENLRSFCSFHGYRPHKLQNRVDGCSPSSEPTIHAFFHC